MIEENPEPPKGDAYYAQRRKPERVYVTSDFNLGYGEGKWEKTARYVHQVYDNIPETEDFSGKEYLVKESPQGRKQVTFLITQEAGHVSKLKIQTVNNKKHEPEILDRFSLEGEDARRFIDLVRQLEFIPVEGEKFRIDPESAGKFLSPHFVDQVYSHSAAEIRRLIQDDQNASDVIATASRGKAVQEFERMLNEPEYFDSLVETTGKQEAVWQKFFESNPWILGTSTEQMVSVWGEKLEQPVTGRSVQTVGKRIDGLMETLGEIRSSVFVEIKHHRTQLLVNGSDDKGYRPGCFRPAEHLSGGVAQLQGTVQRVLEEHKLRLSKSDDEGFENTDAFTYLVRPRAILVVGSLLEFKNSSGGVHKDKYRSFELFRRDLNSLEIVTFDELYEKAKFIAG